MTAYNSWSVVFGEQPSAAKWNILGANDAAFNNGTGIGNLEVGGVTAVKNDYKFSVYRNSAWTAANGTFGLVTFDTKVFDTGSNYSTSTGIFTAPVAGFYQFNAVAFSGVTSGSLSQIAIYKNSSVVQYGMGYYSSSSNVQSALVSALVQCSSSDQIQVFYLGSGGGGQTGIGDTAFSGFLVSNT